MCPRHCAHITENGIYKYINNHIVYVRKSYYLSPFSIPISVLYSCFGSGYCEFLKLNLQVTNDYLHYTIFKLNFADYLMQLKQFLHSTTLHTVVSLFPENLTDFQLTLEIHN